MNAVYQKFFKYPKMKHIRMPLIVKTLCGATIGYLVGLYLVNTFYDGHNNFLVYIGVVLGAVVGIWLFRR